MAEAVTASVPSNSKQKIALLGGEEEEAKAPSEERLRQLDALATERVGALSGSVGRASTTSSTTTPGYGVMMKWLSTAGN